MAERRVEVMLRTRLPVRSVGSATRWPQRLQDHLVWLVGQELLRHQPSVRQVVLIL